MEKLPNPSTRFNGLGAKWWDKRKRAGWIPI